VVLHIGAHKSNFPWLLNQRGPLPASHPKDGDPIEAGHVYVAPPDHHMIVEPGRIRLTKGPRENWVRPAIDPLFRSAARAYGSSVIGVILTGGLSDGTAGLYEVKRARGTTIVQSPEDCINPSMPRSALEHVEVDHCLPLAAMPKLLTRLASEAVGNGFVKAATKAEDKPMTAEFTEDKPVAVTCPDCGGALRRTELGSLTQFRCHIGHVYTADVMLAAQFLVLERALETAMRSIGERAELCRQMAEKKNVSGTADGSAEWQAAMRQAREQMSSVAEMLDHDWIHPGSDLIVRLGDR
jgi:two-component system chemotaxis response regulator CheB